MTREPYQKLFNPDYVAGVDDQLEMTQEELEEEFEEDFHQFLIHDESVKDKIVDIVCEQKEEMIRQAIESTLALQKLVHVGTFYSPEQYERDLLEYEKDWKEQEDFIRIETAAHLFI